MSAVDNFIHPSRRRDISRSRSRSPIRNDSRERGYSRNYDDDRNYRGRLRSSSRDPDRDSGRYRDDDRNRDRSPEERNDWRHRDRDLSWDRGRRDLDRRRSEDAHDDDGGKPGETYAERRRRMRQESTKTIWPLSPLRRDESPDERKKKEIVRDDSDDSNDSDDDSDDSEEERRKRKKKSKSSKKKSKSKKSKKKKKKAASSGDESDDDEGKDSDNAAKAKRSMSIDDGEQTKRHEDPEVEDYWQERTVTHVEDVPFGPVPLLEPEAKLNERAYGGSLLAGEGSAMAAYIQSGKRIPRRGEIGLTADEIETFETSGFVMSGSRHQRMNAVRLRKENQVISAEEKQALLLFNQQEKIRKENETIALLKELVAQKTKDKV